MSIANKTMPFFIQQITKANASQGVEDYKRFRGRGSRGKTFDDQKKEANAKKTFQPISLSIFYHTKTTLTSRGGTTTCINYKDSKPRTNDQT
jgi:hypothetical protein